MKWKLIIFMVILGIVLVGGIAMQQEMFKTEQVIEAITKLPSMFSTSITDSQINTDPIYKVYETGIDDILFNTTVEFNEATRDRPAFYEAVIVPNFQGSLTREEEFDDRVSIGDSNSRVRRNVTYEQPTQIRITYDNSTSFYRQRTSEVIRIRIPDGMKAMKLGEDSIFIVAGTAYNATFLNATGAFGLAHQNISGAPSITSFASDYYIYYPFDDNVSVSTILTTINDYSHQGNNAIVAADFTDTPVTTDGVYSSARSFNGFSDNILVLGVGDTISDRNNTLAWWQLTANVSENFAHPFRQNTGYPIVEYRDQGGGAWRLAGGGIFDIGENLLEWGAGTNVVIGEWEHYAMVFNGTSLIYYKNGAQTSQTGIGAANISTGTGNLFIGSNADSERFFNGSMDEIQAWRRALSASEISALYSNESDRYAQVGYMNFTDENVSIIGTENTVNITLMNASGAIPYVALFDTNLSASIDGGVTWTNFSEDGTITGLSFSTDPNNFNISFLWYSGSERFWAPTLAGNITLDSWTAPTGDSCTYTSGDWNIACSDNCVITSDVDVLGNSIFMTGTGTFTINTGVQINNFDYRQQDRTCFYQANGNGGFFQHA